MFVFCGAVPGAVKAAAGASAMYITRHHLFVTTLLTVEFPDTSGLDEELCRLVERRGAPAAGFNMHPDALNLLDLADTEPAVARLRAMFLEGLGRWLEAEGISGASGVDLVLFSNHASKGEMTLVHNHSADLVGIYYARTPDRDRRPVQQADEEDDYFDPGDGLLILHDPRFNANLAAVGLRDHVKVHPRPGLMLLFPAYLWHSVTPHRGEQSRLSLSMNFTLHWPRQAGAVYHALGESQAIPRSDREANS